MGSPIFNQLFRETPDPRLARYWIPAMGKIATMGDLLEISETEARDVAVNYRHHIAVLQESHLVAMKYPNSKPYHSGNPSKERSILTPFARRGNAPTDCESRIR
jgi:hypothetical protein